MNPVDDYFSESDQSDEDFCPLAEDGGAGDSDATSEEDSDHILDAEQPRVHKRGKQAGIAKEATNKLKDFESERLEKPESHTCRTRQRDDRSTNNKGELEKDVLESDEEDKSRTDALWAHFLSDVKTVSSEKSLKSNQSHCPAKSISGISIKRVAEKPKEKRQSEEPKKITVTEVVDFAGEEVTVQKLLNNSGVKAGGHGRLPSTGYKRTTPAGSGLNSVLNQIGKKKKISVLEKSQHDWKSFKDTEGIAEDLNTHNKGRDGYLDRQDFLERTDLRQFEIEKSLRQSRRNN